MKHAIEAGRWEHDGFPPVVRIGGREYRRADLAAERRPNVVAQYRENRRRHARHLFVLDDGTYRVDHVDAWNPHAGPLAAVLHFFVDHPLGRKLWK